jgi:hypothetical protein
MTAYPISTAPAFRSPHRVSITLSHSTYHQLLERSDHEGRSLSNLAAYLLETSLDKTGHTQSSASETASRHVA